MSDNSADLQRLVDERRALEAQVFGKNVEIAMALGHSEDARYWLRMMEAATLARLAARETGCYFADQGDADRARAQGEALGG